MARQCARNAAGPQAQRPPWSYPTSSLRPDPVSLCVSVERGWFFLMNTKSHWRPNFPLSATNDPCLDRDCFLHLNAPVEYANYAIEEALRFPDNHKGRLSNDTLGRFAEHIPTVPTLTPGEQDHIVEQLTAGLESSSG